LGTQFRGLVWEPGSEVSLVQYLEGCITPSYDWNRHHTTVVELCPLYKGIGFQRVLEKFGGWNDNRF